MKQNDRKICSQKWIAITLSYKNTCHNIVIVLDQKAAFSQNVAFLNFIFCWPFWLIVSVIKQQIVVLNPLTNDCTYVICFSRRITGYIIARILRLFVSTINLELIAHYMFSSFGFTFLTAYITKLEGIF